MEGQSTNGQSQYPYPSAQWSRLLSRRNTLTASTPLSPAAIVQSPQFPTHLDLLPTLLPQQSSAYQEQLANYNKLISSGRTSRVQSSPLPPKLSTAHVQAVPRSGSGSYDIGRRSRNNSRGGHGNKNATLATNGERPPITTEETGAKMAGKKADSQTNLTPRPLPQQRQSSISQQSSSVPSTPHQHPRKFSLSSREPSPNAAANHSPRSAYSESNSTLPSLRPLPPRVSVCRYETAFVGGKRRMPYSLGTDRLDKVKDEDLKPKLSADEERELTGDMRELYDRLLPSSEGEMRRKKFVRKLEKLLNDEWPGHDIQVQMFGSSGNLLCTDESDVDICIKTDWKELEGVCMLADLLAKRGMEKVICVSTAKVPIVKIWDPELGLACDMNVNNPTALENTRMIKTYVQIDERVRPLAMIVKYWTKRRMVNDAAFGGTLSSYTWICMIINFLQTRNPPVLPALHQLPHLKLPSQNGHETDFADDVDALKDFGNANKETLGELLFQFFRYYGHEIDYDTAVISVRSGKLLTKTEKGWHQATNNSLCVEEPFNTPRNLGNTADDTSFRGLHMELRRAFASVADAKLDVCCEQYVFPKEEERIWERPPPAPKPVLSRTPSQTNQTNRRGGGMFRGGRQHRNGGNSGRRASSGNYDNSAAYSAGQLPQGFMSPEQMLQAQQAQQNLHTELYTQLSQLKAQENNLRFQLYSQSQQYAQMQAQAYAQAHRAQGTTGILPQHANERNRGNSFDNPPLTAPIRPDMYFYPMLHPSAVYGQPSPGTYPSSPSMTPAMPEPRRSLHRTTGPTSNGQGSPASSSAMRSHSQPASRSVPPPLLLHGMASSNFGTNSSAGNSKLQPNGIVIPNFIADENGEANAEAMQGHPPAHSSPENGLPKEYVGYYVNGAVPAQPRKPSLTLQAIPAFGDISKGRRRLSSDQFPHAIFDRVRRTSRSPSPLGRSRNYGADPNLAGQSPQPNTLGSTLRPPVDQRPLVVNGSNPIPAASLSPQQTAKNEQFAMDDYNYFASKETYDLMAQNLASQSELWEQAMAIGQHDARSDYRQDRQIVANGTRSTFSDLSRNLQGLGIANGAVSHIPQPVSDHGNEPNRTSPREHLRSSRQHINDSMSPVDIGSSQHESLRDDLPHLSPVYETRSPSPNASRKIDHKPELQRNDTTSTSSTKTSEATSALKLALQNSSGMPVYPSIPNSANGHTRAAKSESNVSGWSQVPKGGKKKSQDYSQSFKVGSTIGEKAPKNESDRKGG